MSHCFEPGELARRAAETQRPYLEFIRSASMSVGQYVLPAGGADHQQPHHEDEVYVVLAGSAKFTAGGEEMRDANPGDVIYVAAGMPHRFHDIVDDLQLIVVFAPPET